MKIKINKKIVSRMSNLLLFLNTTYHFVFLIHHYVVFGFGISVLFSITEEQLKEPLIRMAKTYSPAYITNWNFSFQTTFLCLALTYDVLQWLDKEGSKFAKRIRYLRDIVFNGVVFPCTCIVHFMFWGIYSIDRELVFPAVYDQIMPWWLNHCFHTNVIILIIIETILTTRRYPTDVKVERICYICINIFYFAVFNSIHFFAGCWLYGVFGVMTWWQVCVFQCAMSFSYYVFYRSAFFFNRLIHGPENTEDITTKNNGDVESKDVKQIVGDLRTGNEMKIACVENIQVGGSPKCMKNNLVGDQNGGRGEKLYGDSEMSKNGQNDENGRDWRLIEENGDGGENGTFEKSWSTKYRTSRNQFENSSV